MYAHFGQGDDPYVIEALGKLGDTSPRALELYRQGLESEDDDVFKYTVAALRKNVSAPAIRPLAAEIVDLYRRVDGERRYELLGVSGMLGSPTFEADVRNELQTLEDDEQFETLVYALPDGALRGSPLAQEFLSRTRRMSPNDPGTFNTVAALVEKGAEDPALTREVARAFVDRGGMWTERANALLAR